MTDTNHELTERFIEFYREYYRDAIGTLAQNYPSEQRSLYIDYDDLYRYDHDLAEDFVNQPGQLREYAEEALRLYDLPADVKLSNAHVRLHNLPEDVDISSIRVHDDHIGTLISVSGIVRKATDVRPKITEAAFECKRCSTMTYIPQTDGNFQEPHECQGCERQGPFRVNFDQSEFIDAQKIRVQESPEGLRGGETPQAIDIDLEDDVTGEVTAGDHVTATGVLHIEQQKSGQEKSALFDLYMDGVSVDIDDEDLDNLNITAEDEERIRSLSEEPELYETMVGSVAPTIFGYDEQKLAMLLQLFSGVTKRLPDGSRIRGDSHLLFVGDPGTAKSQLLAYVQHIAPRSVFTSGKGSSSAGLTAAAVRDDFAESQQWTLEAGALVLADKGVAAVDELDKMDASDRSAMHEALEQQTVSVSKAGINATLKSRCSLISACNPKHGRFDQYEPIGDQIDIEPALISRFDLIFTFIDQPDESYDTKLADHVLDMNRAGEYGAHVETVAEPEVNPERAEQAAENADPEISPEFLRKYIAYARRNCSPMMTDDAKDRLRDFYVGLRSKGADEDAPVPVTARKLEALVRLAEASARVRLSNWVEVSDAERVVSLVTSCLEDVGMDPDTKQFDADVIETGTSKSKRDQFQHLGALIEELCEENGGTTSKETIIDEAESEFGWDTSRIKKRLKQLGEEEGVFYQPSPGMVKWMGW